MSLASESKIQNPFKLTCSVSIKHTDAFTVWQPQPRRTCRKDKAQSRDPPQTSSLSDADMIQQSVSLQRLLFLDVLLHAVDGVPGGNVCSVDQTVGGRMEVFSAERKHKHQQWTSFLVNPNA